MEMFRVGVQLQPQHTTYASYSDAVRRAEEIGVDTIFNWDHFYPLSGEPDGKHFESWTLLTAMATLTTRVEVGSLVTCNSYRNPNLLADMARTIDHISSGRLIFGIGAGWFERDYDNYGYEFGTAGSRLKALEANLPIIIERWKQLNPPPTRYIPILVGGGGEKVTLRITAQYANIWNGFGPPETYKHKNEVLDNWCKEVGRSPKNIERSASIKAADLDNLNAFVDAGATHMIMGMSEPWDFGAIERLVNWRDKQQ
jgi:probable F420-dependent oxidoreductase